ncbi:hypothetical protein OF376_03100 [Ureaplasma miroungigenitalium]|uniref:DUF4231 domain-containing protein n=1 Tax=Ureaplasma miroungigenitalium TaxID=1042321 RepID=A0ABT3BNA9_9BACT|nr:hypothetical protein [Ureaplasma miroungigenitalium]MCV3728750.1 hypothetical protein [Ureaplasma miroungigenitalium]MCV3734524.1 hypothetical protein [Ureaplasma miroungigenitalium]
MTNRIIDCIDHYQQTRKYPTLKYYAMALLFLIALVFCFLISILNKGIDKLYILVPTMGIVLFLIIFTIIFLVHKRYLKILHHHFHQKHLIPDKRVAFFLNSLIFFMFDHKYKDYEYLGDELKEHYANIQDDQTEQTEQI